MAQGEDYWRELAESRGAQISTLKDAMGPAIDRVKQFKANFGVRERSNGEIDVDFEKFVENLGIEAALELRAVIDAKYAVTGEPGEKPHVRVVSGG